jgi:hypothetical protein
MRRLISVLLIACTPILLYANTYRTDSIDSIIDSIGSYAAIFSVEYKESSNYIPRAISIYNELCLDSNLDRDHCENDSNEYHLATTAQYSGSIKTDTTYISTQVKYCNIRLGSIGQANSGEYS